MVEERGSRNRVVKVAFAAAVRTLATTFAHENRALGKPKSGVQLTGSQPDGSLIGKTTRLNADATTFTMIDNKLVLPPSFMPEKRGDVVICERHIWNDDDGGATMVVWSRIARAVSKDFKTWSEPVRMQFSGEEKSRNLYSNATMPYFRAPHILISLPHRMISEEVVPRAELEAYKTAIRAIANAIGDVMLMSSRDGTTYDRTCADTCHESSPL